MVVRRDSESFRNFQQSMQDSVDEAVQKLNKALRDIENATLEGMKDGAEIIIAKSQEYVPVDTGTLKASAFVDTEEPGDGILRVSLGYDKDGSAPHAVYVHERLDQKHEAPTRAKFLQTAVFETVKEVVEAIEKKAKKVTK